MSHIPLVLSESYSDVRDQYPNGWHTDIYGAASTQGYVTTWSETQPDANFTRDVYNGYNTNIWRTGRLTTSGTFWTPSTLSPLPYVGRWSRPNTDSWFYQAQLQWPATAAQLGSTGPEIRSNIVALFGRAYNLGLGVGVVHPAKRLVWDQKFTSTLHTVSEVGNPLNGQVMGLEAGYEAYVYAFDPDSIPLQHSVPSVGFSMFYTEVWGEGGKAQFLIDKFISFDSIDSIRDNPWTEEELFVTVPLSGSDDLQDYAAQPLPAGCNRIIKVELRGRFDWYSATVWPTAVRDYKLPNRKLVGYGLAPTSIRANSSHPTWYATSGDTVNSAAQTRARPYNTSLAYDADTNVAIGAGNTGYDAPGIRLYADLAFVAPTCTCDNPVGDASRLRAGPAVRVINHHMMLLQSNLEQLADLSGGTIDGASIDLNGHSLLGMGAPDSPTSLNRLT